MQLYTVLACLLGVCTAENATSRILAAAAADRIDVYSIPVANEALASIQAIYDLVNITVPPAISNGSKVDVHAHVIPPFYRTLVPMAGQVQVPNWTLDAHLDFMAGAGIRHAVISIGAPGSVVFPGSQVKSAALARLLNEYLAALVFKLPDIFSFYAVTPLPYTDASIIEADYAITRLNASGTGLYSNHEGYYLGNSAFKPLFAHLNSRNTSTPIFVHPAGPCLHAANGSLISANPTLYPESIVEFYFETARTFMDLTLTQTILNFTTLKWHVPHGGGAFPATIDRFFGFTNRSADFQSQNTEAFATRFFWDVAGPVFPRQILGLLAYDVPTGQLVYGSDFPYAPRNTFEYEIEAINNVTFLSEREKAGVFSENSRALVH